MAGDRARHLLADHVVRQQQRPALGAGVEDVQHVLAVGRAHHPLVLQVRDVGVEGLGDPRGEVVAAWEDDPLILREAAAGLPDAVEPHDGPGPGVEHQVPRLRLLVRPDAQQDQRADPGVVNLGVRQALQRFVDRLAVDALAGLGVVLDLDGQVAADGLDEHLAADGDVRVPAGHVVVARRLGPLEVVRRREHVVALAPVVDVGDRAVGGGVPPQHPHVLRARARLEHREQLAFGLPELQQAGLPVVPVQLAEVALEAGVAQQAGELAAAHVLEAERLALAHEPVQGEDVVHGRLRLQPDEDVVAEQHQPARRHDVAGHAVVLRADPLGADEAQLGAAEDREALGVERLGPPGELGGLLGQPRSQHVVRALGKIGHEGVSGRR